MTTERTAGRRVDNRMLLAVALALLVTSCSGPSRAITPVDCTNGDDVGEGSMKIEKNKPLIIHSSVAHPDMNDPVVIINNGKLEATQVDKVTAGPEGGQLVLTGRNLVITATLHESGNPEGPFTVVVQAACNQ